MGYGFNCSGEVAKEAETQKRYLADMSRLCITDLESMWQSNINRFKLGSNVKIEIIIDQSDD